MQKRASYVLVLLIILLLGSGIAIGAGSDVCPVQYPEVQTIIDSPQEERSSTLEKGTSVPRNCVVNSADVVYLINYLFVAGLAPLRGCAWW
jgi:hypothetical protein